MSAAILVPIASGSAALLVGAIAVAAREGDPLHARAGTGFFDSTFPVGVSAALIAVAKPDALGGGPRARRQPHAGAR